MDFASVCCDWMSFRHEYAEPIEARNSGRIMKIDADGVIEWETQQWEQIKCASSDTSIRVKCDGKTLRGMANIGRFQQPDNVTGLTVNVSPAPFVTFRLNRVPKSFAGSVTTSRASAHDLTGK